MQPTYYYAATSLLLKQQNHRLDLPVGLGGGCFAEASCAEVSLNDALRIFASSSGGSSNASTHCRVRSRGSMRRSLRGSKSLMVLLIRAAGCVGMAVVVVVVVVTRGWCVSKSGGAFLVAVMASAVVAATTTGTVCVVAAPLSGADCTGVGDAVVSGLEASNTACGGSCNVVRKRVGVVRLGGVHLCACWEQQHVCLCVCHHTYFVCYLLWGALCSGCLPAVGVHTTRQVWVAKSR